MFQQLLEELTGLDARVATYDAQLAQVAQTHPVCQRLMTIPGLGELTATALVAAIGDAAQCKNGRQFAAWLGLVVYLGVMTAQALTLFNPLVQ